MKTGKIENLNNPQKKQGCKELSLCCNAPATITIVNEYFPCHKCTKCNKLTGVVDEYGERIN